METLLAESNRNATLDNPTAPNPQLVRFYCCESRIIDAAAVDPDTADLFAFVTSLT
ncbi:MAG: hypothetical protein JST93_01825 [Acidobacteria bacterium]|nr:hypothetical protein [Acidobacteriota bacterium]